MYCICIYVLYMYVCMYVCIDNMYIYMYQLIDKIIYMYVCTYICMYAQQGINEP